MKILVRLPNWLGDMVMSIGFINALQQIYPQALISVIAKKGIHELLEYFPPLAHRFIFSKDEYKGTPGAWRFGRMIKKKEAFDLFFCLPDSFSSALIGFASGAKQRIGYGKELRSVLLTRSFIKEKKQHRVAEYVALAEKLSTVKVNPSPLRLSVSQFEKTTDIVININSEASSRRLPLQKSVSLIKALQVGSGSKLLMIGAKGDTGYVESVLSRLPHTRNMVNLAGKTTLSELVMLLASSKLVLTTDSGPAHIANATGTKTIVLFGAGNENNTAPYNKSNRTIIRLGQLPCEPCVKNTCILYGIPKCLELLDEQKILEIVSHA